MSRAVVASELHRLTPLGMQSLRQKLEQEYSLAVASLDVPGARIYGRRLNDEILRSWQQIFDPFAARALEILRENSFNPAAPERGTFAQRGALFQFLPAVLSIPGLPRGAVTKTHLGKNPITPRWLLLFAEHTL